VWDAHTHRALLTIHGHVGSIITVAFSPDGKRIVVGGHQDTAVVWDAQTGAELLTLRGPMNKGHDVLIVASIFSPDGKRILTAGNDDHVPPSKDLHTTAEVWDAQTGQALFSLKGHRMPITSIAVSADGRYILTGSYDSSMKKWDSRTGELVSNVGYHLEHVTSVDITSDGRRTLVGSVNITDREESSILSGSLDGTVREW
jgi:WD40 repeat protein